MSYMNPEHKFANRTQRIHLIGIGGSGMSGIAEVLHNLGFSVSGSDLNTSGTTRRLQNMGITVHQGHDAEYVKGTDVVVYSSAIKAANPELKSAREAHLPILTRAEMLAELMRFKVGIAVAGTHGKTTTTSLIASTLNESGLDPTFVIGGLLNSAGTNAVLGQSEYLVAEADESDGSFQLLQPLMAVVTNIDADHMETFGHDFDQLKQAFSHFLHRIPFYGIAIVCIDDPAVRQVEATLARHVVSYGLSDDAQIQARSIRQESNTMMFDVYAHGKLLLKDMLLNMPGVHNVRNALAAIAVALELEVEPEHMAKAMKEFSGIGRRFNIYKDMKNGHDPFLLVDDYGHHPTEIAAVVQACRDGWPESRLVVAFQPHRYSRTHELFDEFAAVLNEPDLLLMTDVYAAGEEPIAGAATLDLCRSVRNRGKLDPIYVGQLEDLKVALANVVKAGDVVLMLGAGNIGAAIEEIVESGQLKTEAAS
ncbi:UDP-N-acetylmuramate--L-alanine ligase [Marinicella sp. W31]|uniref:UDP-N-acetylmuramate--L-alanine ligase n=1 Tax=Marinicella sp. W31 TaxID=3023713 RepID=UPI00375630D6